MKKRYYKNLVSVMMVIVLVISANFSVFAATTENNGYESIDLMFQQADNTPIVTAVDKGVLSIDAITDPVTSVKEGAYDSVVWIANMSGSGSTCWIELDYGTKATQLKTILTVERSTGLWIHYDYYDVVKIAKNANNVYSRWDSDATFVALCASGKAYINGTQVTGMSVDGWWS